MSLCLKCEPGLFNLLGLLALALHLTLYALALCATFQRLRYVFTQAIFCCDIRRGLRFSRRLNYNSFSTCNLGLFGCMTQQRKTVPVHKYPMIFFSPLHPFTQSDEFGLNSFAKSQLHRQEIANSLHV